MEWRARPQLWLIRGEALFYIPGLTNYDGIIKYAFLYYQCYFNSSPVVVHCWISPKASGIFNKQLVNDALHYMCVYVFSGYFLQYRGGTTLLLVFNFRHVKLHEITLQLTKRCWGGGVENLVIGIKGYLI